MGRAELILVFGAIAIFGIFSLTILDMQLHSRIANVNRKYEDAAVSLANSILNMADNEHYSDPEGGLTAPLGPDPDSATTIENNLDAFDDVDDYIGLTGTTLKVPNPGKSEPLKFKVDTFNVYYLSEAGIVDSSRKKLVLRLSSDYLPSQIEFSRTVCSVNR